MSDTLLWALAGWMVLNYGVAVLLSHRALRQAEVPRLAALTRALAWPSRLFPGNASGV